jgi:hypothetical protein
MRTTLTIDDDVLRAARQRADARGESLGAAVSAMARASLVDSMSVRAERNGIVLLPMRSNAPAVTLEDVNRIRDDLDVDD